MDHPNYDWPAMAQKLISALKLQTPPIGLKFYQDKAEMKTVSKVRIPPEGSKHHVCQLIGQAVRLNFTVGFTSDNIFTNQCRGVFGMIDREFHVQQTGLANVWYATEEDAKKHQAAMYTLPNNVEAIVISPLAGGRIEPDVCGVYCTPQQLCFIGCALQFYDYEPLQMQFVGESACSDTWAKAYVTGKPSASVPCFGERRYGGVLDNEMLIAFPPDYMEKILTGLSELGKRGLRYPASYYGLQHDVRGGMAKNYNV